VYKPSCGEVFLVNTFRMNSKGTFTPLEKEPPSSWPAEMPNAFAMATIVLKKG